METYAKQYADAKKANNLTELTAIYKKWEKKGDFIIGAYVGQNEVTSGLNAKLYNQYLFDTDQGLTKFHLGKGADLEIGKILAEGRVYHIEFTGQIKIKGGRNVNTFTCVELGGGSEIPESEPESR